jgi:hypothetical protein
VDAWGYQWACHPCYGLSIGEAQYVCVSTGGEVLGFCSSRQFTNRMGGLSVPVCIRHPRLLVFPRFLHALYLMICQNVFSR